LAKLFFSAKSHQVAVICQRTELSAKDYLAVQELAVIELGLALIPVSDQSHLPQLIAQFSAVNKKPNPFKFGSQSSVECPSRAVPSRQLIDTLTTIPGVGERGARILLEEFKTLQRISQASEAELSKAAGSGVAKSVHQHFDAPVRR